MIDFYRNFGMGKRKKFHSLIRRLAELVIKAYSSLGGMQFTSKPYIKHTIEMILGRYEQEYVKILSLFIKPGDLVVDVGANIGYFSIQFSKLVGQHGSVVAFEPNPKAFEILKRNTSRKENIKCFNLGLSDKSSRLDFFIPDDNTAVASLVKDFASANLNYFESGQAESLQHIKVDVVNGSDFLDSKGIENIKFIKIDVEGWEMNVLKGLESLIKKSPELVVFIEFNILAQTMSGHKPEELLNYLVNLGFNIFCISEDSHLQRICLSKMSKIIEKLGSRGYTTLVCCMNFTLS